MSHSKYTDIFCVVILVLTLLCTLLFMNGERLGLTAVESDMSADLNGTYSDRDLEQGYDSSSAQYIDLSDLAGLKLSNAYELDGDLYLTSKGTFVLSGEMAEGHSVIVDAKNAKLQIVLSGVTIENESEAPIYIKKADKVFLTLDEGTENVISLNSLPGSNTEDAELTENTAGTEPSGAAENMDASGTDTDADQDEYVINAAIYSRSDLTINGSGSLTVTTADEELNGIRTSDDLVITGGNISVNAGKNGIVGHDSLRIADGTIAVVSGSDALKANNDTTLTSGYVQIDGGSITLTAGDDGIHGEASVTVNGGTISILESYEGIEAYDITVNAGDISVNASNDGFNAGSGFGNNMGPGGMGPGGDPGSGGNMGPGEEPGAFGNHGGNAGGFGGHGDMMGPDGMESGTQDGTPPEPPEGMMKKSQDDGAASAPANASASASSGVERTELPNLIINGGTITVNAQGDGLDSNGNLTINGGLIYVNGPTNGGNGALDCGTESGGKLTVNSGTLIALGASGMAESFGEGSQQSSVVFTSNETWQAGDVLEIRAASENGEMSDSISEDTDAADQTDQVNVGSKDGTVIFSCTAVKSGNSVVFTSGELKTGETYVLYLNGEEAASGTAAADTSGDIGGFDAPAAGSRPRSYGSMYRDEVTPDGFRVDASGAWTE
ncbi:MAG: carbohydrate-binding domain-containing protein [Lachnospiraceae bacterium]|nr:carbohydrate-binding domain-containing protein [Lachnospiraceae bacterium]